VQEFNRDISICVINTFLDIYRREKAEKNAKQKDPKPARKVRILEALSATGLRSIRYAKEIEGVDEIIANDLSSQAVEMIKRNVKENEVEGIVTPNKADAMTFMYTSTAIDKRFTVIDLDPYGGPNMFLDGAIQSIEDGGLLLVTATDMAVLAGNTPEACEFQLTS
jgi:tRNA (guanine26-N2/guanine27-N2)-dimethyltransferase